MTLALFTARRMACGMVALAAGTAETAFAQDRNRTVVGLAGIHTPAYQGSDKYRTLPFPVIDIKRDRFYANARRGVGWSLVDGDKISVGAGMTFVPGYRRRDAPAGIGRLKNGAGARVSADLRTGMAMISLGATKVVSGGVDGALIDAGLALPLRVSPRLTLVPAVSATWADRTYNNRYFGVTPAQSLASGLPVYRAGGGIKDVSASLGAMYRLNDRVTLGATASLSSLQGDAKDSPIVADPTQPAVFVSAAYRF
ncbi:MipA/OmpV family protein [Caulobacter sp.]|uniref:MipA/OmpV family protein n=1 Tax=Caulobacter sp. TaxID=78 RepID=UPI00161C5783